MTQKYKIEHSNELKKVFEIAKKNGGEARFVGGAVRNFLLNQTPLENGDVDISINLPVDLVAKIFNDAGAKVITKYATNIVVINGRVFEITSTRRDENCDGRHATMIFTPSFEEDARRRDFTINALFMDEDGKIYDYFNGLEDLKNKVVRFIGNPEYRIEEDGLRIWRFFRFSCLYANSINQEGLNACVIKKSILHKISKERVTSEMMKLLTGLESMIKFILNLMIEGGILDYKNFNLNYNLSKNNFERLVILNSGLQCETFLYTAKQKKLINLYNNVRKFLNQEYYVYKLFYLLSKEEFNFIINIGIAVKEVKNYNFNLPKLPFSKQDIIKEGFEGGMISKEFENRLENFCKQLVNKNII